MEIKDESEKLTFQHMNDPEWLKEDHSKYNFGEPESSTSVDQNGDAHDSSFRVQSGKVSYDKISDGLYMSSFKNESGVIEKREVSLEILSAWFYDPSDEYYNNVILPIPISE